MPNLIVTNIGKITPTEEANLSSKSLDFSVIFAILHISLMEKLIDIMEEDDDVQNVWHNWEE